MLDKSLPYKSIIMRMEANRFTELQSVVTLYHALGGGRETETAQ